MIRKPAAIPSVLSLSVLALALVLVAGALRHAKGGGGGGGKARRRRRKARRRKLHTDHAVRHGRQHLGMGQTGLFGMPTVAHLFDSGHQLRPGLRSTNFAVDVSAPSGFAVSDGKQRRPV